MKIMLVAGARPNFMKVASIVDAIRAYTQSARSPIEYQLVHTGQHYDKEMSDSFFADLELPVPHMNLGVGSSSHACQTADIMKGIEPVLLSELPDLLVVVGDVNSTVACALVASKITYPVGNRPGLSRPSIAHVEAGLRSFDRSMPEEINRVLTDALCDFLFVTERDAEANLLREGIASDKIYMVGNTMVDTLLKHRERAKRSRVLARLGLTPNSDEPQAVLPYATTTLHRPSNVDDRRVFGNILDALKAVGERLPVFFPVHPRTMSRIREFGFEAYFDLLEFDEVSDCVPTSSAFSPSQATPRVRRIIALKPLGYIDFLCLMDNAKLVLTDSGGIQEETTVLGVPCVTVRENTERPVTLTHGTNVLAGTSTAAIVHHCLHKLDHPQVPKQPELWDGRAGTRIIEILSSQPGQRRIVT
jgi:UDP-N-acetylglucosamine 2-epimerase (non-hydrolysing)